MDIFRQNFIIAVDGGAGTGKSTLSNEIARRLNIIHIDTGALYRAATLYFLNNNIEITDENIDKNLENIKIELKNNNGGLYVFLNGEDVTGKIRTEIVSNTVPMVAKYPPLRKKIVAIQREIGNSCSCIIDGRDIGTVVFPEANLKIFLTASLEKRAQRRKSDLAENNENVDLNLVKSDLEKRDMQDKTREHSPLKMADDAIQIDTTENTVEQTADIIIDLLKQKVM